LVEPVAVAVHAVARAGRLAGRNVAVLGAGPIGNLVAQAARSRGAKVLITDVSPFRLGIARKCGLGHVSDASRESLADASARIFGGRGFDVAFECAGAGASLDAAVSSIAKGGTVVVVGVFGERPRVDVGLIQDRELALVGTLMYRRPDFVEAVRLMKRGGIATRPLESRHFPFERYPDAYRHIQDEGVRCMKVFLDL
jgi:threonine dehydrogenase-like Zn-dependent dehydrogenase